MPIAEPFLFICLPFAFNLPFIPFRGSFRPSFCPSRFRTFDSQRIITVAIPASVVPIPYFASVLPPCHSVARCSTFPFTAVNYQPTDVLPFLFLNHQTEVLSTPLLRLSILPTFPFLLFASPRSPGLFSLTLRGGSQGRQGAGRSPKVLLWHACANLCQKA